MTNQVRNIRVINSVIYRFINYCSYAPSKFFDNKTD